MIRPEPKEPVLAIAVHGGAGAIDASKMTPEREKLYRDTLAAALDAGYAVLESGGSSVDAVVAAVVLLEDAPFFNAGRGSVFTNKETVEMDASIMEGGAGNAGAVAAIRGVKNPILAARKVLDESPHVLLSATGAEEFAERQGLETVPPEYFRSEERLEQLRRAKEAERIELDHGSDRSSVAPFEPEPGIGTVGAVAVDRHGRLAAATSTGGMTNKRYGRVGDSPIIGAGTWAKDSTCAVSCTGHGEYFIREAAAHSVSARMELAGDSLEDAARAVIFEQIEGAGGRGGLIAVDRAGNVAMPFNSGGMFRGFRRSDGSREVRIWGE
jgi:L-asparaginase / beta-aspartyl-peptidase